MGSVVRIYQAALRLVPAYQDQWQSATNQAHLLTVCGTRARAPDHEAKSKNQGFGAEQFQVPKVFYSNADGEERLCRLLLLRLEALVPKVCAVQFIAPRKHRCKVARVHVVMIVVVIGTCVQRKQWLE